MNESPVPVALILSHKELCVLTGLRRYRAQARALARMDITFRLRPDGFPIVSRAHFEAIMGTESNIPPSAATEPDWSALRVA